jgi:hypothetical protein
MCKTRYVEQVRWMHSCPSEDTFSFDPIVDNKRYLKASIFCLHETRADYSVNCMDSLTRGPPTHLTVVGHSTSASYDIQ